MTKSIISRSSGRKRLTQLISVVFVLCGASLFSISSYGQSGTVNTSPTLLEIRKRGSVLCGVNQGLKGFAQPNSLGDYSGLDSDFCRAVASAIFDDPGAVKFVPLSASERFEALQSKSIDLLARNATWTLSRNADFGEFVGVNYFDGQGFLVPKRSGIRSALELDNQGICVLRDTTSASNATDYFSVNKMRYRPVFFDNSEGLNKAYDEGRCAALTGDISTLAATRETLKRSDAHGILPEVISKEPLGPMVPHGDSAWANLVRWTLNCMINAEEMGINNDNIDTFTNSPSPSAARLLGTDGDLGERMGVDNKWCANVIGHVGNYGESFERNVGENTSLGLARGVNRLWTDGGLLYAPPMR